jgi:hypothetical protein
MRVVPNDATEYLLSSRANAKDLFTSMMQNDEGASITLTLAELLGPRAGTTDGAPD